jgi:hypothetical protein
MVTALFGSEEKDPFFAMDFYGLLTGLPLMGDPF